MIEPFQEVISSSVSTTANHYHSILQKIVQKCYEFAYMYHNAMYLHNIIVIFNMFP